jgi:hypothetical protein
MVLDDAGSSERDRAQRGARRRRWYRQSSAKRGRAVETVVAELEPNGGHGGRPARQRQGEGGRARERGSAGRLGAFGRQGQRGMGVGRTAPAACPGGAVVNLAAVTTNRAEFSAMCPSWTHNVADSRQNQPRALYKRSSSPFTLRFLLRYHGH